MDERLIAFQRLLDIMDKIREGCPWDSKQTIESLRHLTIEETFELSEAILAQDLNEVKKELGDLMLHIVFYSKIGAEQQAFTITDVLNGICEKLIIRHPHIFGGAVVKDEQEVSQNWEKIKLQREGCRGVLAGVPNGLPPLLKSYRMQQKTAGVGFQWENKEDAWKKVEEEKNEFLKEVRKADDPENREAEFGDLMFALINYARYVDVNPDDALEKTNKKFARRFSYIEQCAKTKGVPFQDLSLDEMVALWKEAKTKE